MLNKSNPSTSWPELTAILLVRLAFLWFLVLVSLAMPNDDATFYAFMGFAFIITIPYSLWLRSKLHSAQLVPLQFIVDLVLVTGLIYFTGGVNSELTLLYPLVILSAGIVATPKQAAKITILGILIYLLLVVMLSQNILVDYPSGEPGAGAQPLYPAIILRILTFILFGAASIYVSKRCNYFNQHNQDAQNTAQTLLGNLGTNLLLLDRKGTVLFANPPACDVLQTTLENLSTRTFAELCVSEMRPIPEHHGQSAYLARFNAPPIPIAFHSTDILLPATALPNLGDKLGGAKLTLLTFSDLSLPVDLERQLEQVQRITAATRIAGEMANEIRTPLTAISASVQLLKHYENKTTAADWLPNSPRKKDRIELFDHIMSASHDMDAVIQNFLNFAEFSPADLLSIIKLDSIDQKHGYIGHLNTIAKGFEHGQNSDSGRRSDHSKLIE